MSRDWPKVKLGDILTERKETPDLIAIQSGDISIVSKIGFERGQIEIRQESNTKTGMILVRPGDLLISGINASKGAISIYGELNSRPVAATIHYGAYIINKKKASSRYLWRYLRSDSFREILRVSLPEGIKTELKSKRLLPLEIPLPPLAEQERIVARIEELAGKISEACELRKQAEEEGEALFYKSLEQIRLNLMAHSKCIFPLGSVTKVTSGGTPSRDNSNFWNGKIPWVKTGELLDGDLHDSEEKITEYAILNSAAKVFPENTILIALYGQGQTRGRTARLMIPAATNQACCAILPNEKINPEYLQYWLRSQYIELRETSRAGAQPNWNSGMIKDLKICLPTLDEQVIAVKKFTAVEKEISKLKKLQSETEAELQAMLPTILDKAFKGEL